MNKVTKKRYLLIISTLFAATLGGAIFAGCSQQVLTGDGVINAGFTCAVTFDTAGGVWASGAQIDIGAGQNEDGEENNKIETTRMELRQMYLKPGSTLNQDEAEKFANTVREGYTFNAFYTGTKDDKGNVTYGERWDFTKPVNDSITLYARWMENYSLVAHYGENFSKTKTFNVPQNRDGVAQRITTLSFTSENVTVVAMYENADKTGEFTVSYTSPYTAPCTPEHKVHDIYVETLDGDWTLVRDKKDFNIYAANWLYLLTDIDFEGEEIDFPDEFNGKIHGNGHTVSNFKVVKEAVDKDDQNFGLFKEITDGTDADGNAYGAEIKDITFADVHFTAVLSNPIVKEYNAGIFAGKVTENTVIKNVTVTGFFQFAITTKGREEGSNLYEETQVDVAIGYREHIDPSKYEVNMDGVQAVKKEYEKIEKDRKGDCVFNEDGTFKMVADEGDKGSDE